MIVVTDERCIRYSSPKHPERPARISATLETLRAQRELPLRWEAPLNPEEATILRAHSPEFLNQLKTTTLHFDKETPTYQDIYAHAALAVGGALKAMECARAGEPAFSLMRPPGHHALRDQVLGYCYLNSAAIAALEALATGLERVAVYDFDVHHGNGTEAILLNLPGAAFYSVHQYPGYPLDSGAASVGNNCFNYPMPPKCPRAEYWKTLMRALEDMKRFEPQLVVISAGFDAFEKDPVGQEKLVVDDYYQLGVSLRQLGIPAFSLLEGGYSEALPQLILAYLKGIAGA